MSKVTEVIYKLNWLLKIKIYPAHHIAILKLVHGYYKPLIYNKTPIKNKSKINS